MVKAAGAYQALNSRLLPTARLFTISELRTTTIRRRRLTTSMPTKTLVPLLSNHDIINNYLSTGYQNLLLVKHFTDSYEHDPATAANGLWFVLDLPNINKLKTRSNFRLE